MRVLIAPDSFKGTVGAPEVAAALSRGWLRARPADTVVLQPMADGGEGSLDVLASTTPGSLRRFVRVLGPGGPVMAPWLLCPDGTAFVELAAASGLPLLKELDPMQAHTHGFGELLAAAAKHPDVRKIVAALGGSASTDGGTGALTALGAKFCGPGRSRIPLGGVHLTDLARIDTSRLIAPPGQGVEVLVDVDAPLVGPDGAAHQFAAQKGADAAQIDELEAGLLHYAHVVGHPVGNPGSGAAGGTAYGLVALWGARLSPGVEAIARRVRLDDLVSDVDLVVTGEGRLDRQSFQGKVVGHVTSTGARFGLPVWACVGQQTGDAPQLAGTVQLARMAGSVEAAMADPGMWLENAGERLAALAASDTAVTTDSSQSAGPAAPRTTSTLESA
ncbi:MAG: glycerate kinase [Nocardioides sp.]|uniref:glycerate kinase n=1 Tax=Nocardioides sp. TaxID=35761 RepID=UPI0039E5D44A